MRKKNEAKRGRGKKSCEGGEPLFPMKKIARKKTLKGGRHWGRMRRSGTTRRVKEITK